MKTKKNRRPTKAERAARLAETRADAHQNGYECGVDAGRAQQAATYEDRRYAMAEKLIDEAVVVSRSTLLHGGLTEIDVRVIDAFVRMMPYRNHGNQRP